LILAAAALCAISAAEAAGQTTTNNTGLVLEIMARRFGRDRGRFRRDAVSELSVCPGLRHLRTERE
jgi:hypothetical protein